MGGSKARWRRVVPLLIVLAGVLWGGWSWAHARRDRRALAAAREQIKAGLHATAARNLTVILAGNPDSGEAAYLLGTCELASGRPEAALESWARVPPDSRFAASAFQGRIRTQIERGQLAKAEQIFTDALVDPRTHRLGLPILLGPVYCLQGRLEEALRLIEAQWNHLNEAGLGASEKAVVLVRLHIDFQRTTPSIEAIRSDLENAAQIAPDDDRIWLAKANLATRAGAFDDAAPWLDACLRRRTEDVPVWRARLDWAIATNHIAVVHEALKHLPANESTPTQVARLEVWLAARRGDVASERRALERQIEADPADFRASDRLAELAMNEGHPQRAAGLRDQKSELAQLQARYLKLHARNQPMRDAATMAALAEQLGRWFEARVFLTVAIAAAPGRVDLRRDLTRLHERRDTIGGTRRTLAELLAPEHGDASSRY
jgi:enediyne biosynthesis protein E4